MQTFSAGRHHLVDVDAHRGTGHGYVQACPGCGSEHGDAVGISVLQDGHPNAC